MHNLALRFIRWGTGLLVLGLITGYGPLGHYLMGGSIPSCPAAPVHGHSILLGWVGMTLFGLVYRALPNWSGGKPPALGLARAHFTCCVVGMLGAFANGTFGYAILKLVNDGFYYHAWTELWLGEWISADAVFDQLPADATHIKLMDGGPERHIALVSIIGRLAFEVEEVSS